MKILVTGSSGHLGEAVCRVLKSKSISYVGADIKESSFTSHLGSIDDRTFVKEIIKGIDYILHIAALHKPHIVTHSKRDFIGTNIIGTLNLLEEAELNNVKGFIFTSTTSTFGDMLTPQKGEPAIWVREDTPYISKNIYGITKNASEDLCQIFYRNHKLPCIVLKTSRFFSEDDDKKSIRDLYDNNNIKANEYLYRRIDIEDVVLANLLAIQKVEAIGFSKYIICSTSPFQKKHLAQLNTDAIPVIENLFPQAKAIYTERGWKMLPRIDRVYVNQKAREELGWKPKYDFQHILNCLQQKIEFRSELALQIGSKGYHNKQFVEGPYPVTNDNI